MGTIFGLSGGSLAFGLASGGKIYGYNNIGSSAPVVVAQASAFRTKITFHNPGTVDVFVAQTVIQNVLGTAPISPSDVPFVPTTALLGGTFRVYANGGTLVVDGECQKAWQALASSGTTNPLTVIETNV